VSGRLSLSGYAADFLRTLRERSAIEIIALLSLALIIFAGYSASYFTIAVAFLVLPALLYRPLLEHWLFWTLIAAVSCFVVLHQWYHIDNHKFLLFYWTLTLALAFSLSPERQQAFLARTARFLLIFIMAGAVIQKTLSTSYLDASFFEFSFLTDSRFELFMTALGADRADLKHNQEIINWIESAYLENDISATILRSSRSVRIIAVIVTWWDYLIQLAIAVAFLIRRRLFDLLGHILLLGFIVTTYLVAPVIGFGWTLSILGYAMSAERFPKLALCYLATFPLLTVYGLPWDAVI
jgi:hypothetical protein